MAPGLPLHPVGWRPTWAAEDGSQSSHHDASRWPLAWRRLDVRDLGTAPWTIFGGLACGRTGCPTHFMAVDTPGTSLGTRAPDFCSVLADDIRLDLLPVKNLGG